MVSQYYVPLTVTQYITLLKRPFLPQINIVNVKKDVGSFRSEMGTRHQYFSKISQMI